MFFNSIEFLIFFPIVVLLYFAVPDKAKKFWLLVASFYFYMCWNAKYALLLLVSTLISYLCGIGIEKCNKTVQKKWLVAASLLSNLGILFTFKYVQFFSQILEEVLSLLHIQVTIPSLNLLLPVGISFYTFQALGYVIDVYRGEIPAERNFVRYALFVSFFPQLVAGPIERSKNMLPQILSPGKFNFEEAKEGFLLMLWGFFLKIVIADRIAIFVDEVYGNYSIYPKIHLILATMLFAFQIYCDFYGYSIIALGTARILGFSLTENFNAPYFSTSVAKFWKNWHISLTSWFRDYIYIPMGGNKKGALRKYINILVVFLVSGLWHGASLSFVIWGGLNGLYQVVGSLTENLRNRLSRILHANRQMPVCLFIRGLITFALVDISWIFFRAEGVKEAVGIIKAMLSRHNPWSSPEKSLFACGLNTKNFAFLMVCLIILGIADIFKKKGIVIHKALLKRSNLLLCLIIPLIIIFILTFGKYGPAFDARNFIYFQF